MELNAALWSNLPSEIVDRILAHMPAPALCRNRILCKRLNELLCTPLFSALCAQHSREQKDEDAQLHVIRYVRSDSGMATGTHGWCALDVATKRWYNFNDDKQDARHNFRSHVVAMDGGLFCQFQDPEISSTMVGDERCIQVIVYNPLAKTVKKLPLVPAHLTAQAYPELYIDVDRASGEFKVYLINQYFDTKVLYHPKTSMERRQEILNDPLMRIYDSATNEWKSAANPTCIRKGISRLGHAVMYQGLLYVFMVQNTLADFGPGAAEPVWRYDMEHDSWENLKVNGQVRPRTIARVFDLPRRDGQLVIMSSFRLITPPQLVVCAKRLFVSGWSNQINPLEYPNGRRTRLWIQGVAHERRVSWSFAVSEINIPNQSRETIFEMTVTEIMTILDIPPTDSAGGSDLQIVKRTLDLPPYVCVFALGNSLMLMSAATGKCIAYDLATSSWDYDLPPSPVLAHNADHSSLSGKQMNLLLPNTPW